jgi:predicted metal-dependent RNase
MVESEGTKLLLDAGVKLGKETEFPLITDSELKTIDGIVMSHAHLDHSGYLPHIFSAGYGGLVYALKPTFELSNVLISDYMRISNPSNVTKEGLKRLQKGYKLVEYNQEFKVKGLSIKMFPAGHILGSALILVSDSRESLLYTGDMNLRVTKLLDPAQTEDLSAEILIMESTYSGTKDTFLPEKKTIETMLSSIKDTISKNGKVIIPSFGVGRAQEVLLLLDDYMKSGLIPKTNIYMDGMIGKAMRIHRHNVIYCRDELQKRILMNDDDPFKSVNFHNVTTRQQRNRIMFGEEAAIVVTTSGMLTGGPVLTYLEHMANNPQNKLILVGYQAEGTLGRALESGAKSVNIDGKKVEVRMTIEKYHLSAHADRQQLLSFVGRVKGLRKIFIVHGEPEKSEELREALKDKYDAVCPQLASVYQT